MSTTPSAGVPNAWPEPTVKAADMTGVVVADRYEIASELGKGGQSVVFRARDRVGDRDVAVKMLVMGGTQSKEFAARLAREQEALLALAGTSAVAVYDLCRAPNGCLCLVMELLVGSDLELVLEGLEGKGELLSLPRLSAIIEPIVDTLERAHDAGILHRDVKPGNVFVLDEERGVRLLDFGFSRMKTATPLTQAGTILGSPSYIAPEVWKGESGSLDHRVDVYSLGVILFRALSGRLPFQSESLHGAFVLATTAQRPSLRALRRDLPPGVDEWVRRALAIDREARYAGVRELWKGLLDALAYTPPPPPFRPVADSLVSAWRAATGAFRRFIDGPMLSATGEPSIRHEVHAERGKPSLSKAPPSRRGARGVPPPLPVPAQARAPDDEWLEVADDEMVTPSRPAVREPVATIAARTEARTRARKTPALRKKPRVSKQTSTKRPGSRKKASVRKKKSSAPKKKAPRRRRASPPKRKASLPKKRRRSGSRPGRR